MVVVVVVSEVARAGLKLRGHSTCWGEGSESAHCAALVLLGLAGRMGGRLSVERDGMACANLTT